jgi:hypothetical protein
VGCAQPVVKAVLVRVDRVWGNNFLTPFRWFFLGILFFLRENFTSRSGKLAVSMSPTWLIFTESSITSVSLILMLTEPFSEDCRNSSIVVFGVMLGCAQEKSTLAEASALSDLQMSIRSLMDSVGG